MKLTAAGGSRARDVVALVFRCPPLNEPLDSTRRHKKAAGSTPAEIRTHIDEAYAIRILDALRPRPAQARAHHPVALRRDR